LRDRSPNDDAVTQWDRSLRDLPSLHTLRLHEIDTTHVVKALKAIWWENPISANRTRERLEKVLSAAKVEKFRTGENPAAWRDNLKHLLPSPRKLNKKKGHAAVQYEKAPALMAALAYDGATIARCVEVGILTCTRSQEIRWMEWTELDLVKKKTWPIPGEKMKIKGEGAGKPHLVPLTDQSIAIIQSMRKVGRYVFSSDHAIEHQPLFRQCAGRRDQARRIQRHDARHAHHVSHAQPPTRSARIFSLSPRGRPGRVVLLDQRDA